MKRQSLIFLSILLFSFVSSTVLAHNIKTNADVGVTFHIEPNHNPKAGEESQAWFALTRQGGELISLSQCECQLNVYLESANDAVNQPILTPQLIAISPEKYQNIPGANLTFPQPGIYQLQLQGKPTVEGDFQPFNVTYPVTVKTGVISSEKETIVKTDNQETTNQTQAVNNPPETDDSLTLYPWLIGIVIVVLGFTAIQKFSK